MKLSIITVCYNNLQGLIKTVESVKAQTFTGFEFIVIDGDSSDGSAEYLKENSDLFSYWVSEKDGGIYNAMNKGIEVAKGEYCLFLNSGDYLANDDVLKKVFGNNYDSDILYGDIIRTRRRKKKIYRYPDKLTFKDFTKRSAAIHHQAAFIKRDLFSVYGPYREDLYLNSDWQFFFKTVVGGNVSTKHISIIVSICNADGKSNVYNEQDERVIKDEIEKNKSIANSIPLLALEDYKDFKLDRDKKELFGKFWWNISAFIPLSFYIKR